MRGDDSRPANWTKSGEGSPPRARGRPRHSLSPPGCPGLTPACAGTTAAAPASRHSARAHPRVRGDDVVIAPVPADVPGSPPRARGRLRRRDRRVRRRGLTPACAGTTQPVRHVEIVNGAHPRVRGDDLTPVQKLADDGGSPPRARGRRAEAARRGLPRGLTPACAGTTCSAVRSAFTVAAHPRVRGDDILAQRLVDAGLGSPPRARGRHPFRVGGLGSPGLTPACAGTTGVRAAARTGKEAHPRVRGDDPEPRGGVEVGRGSPPRARGRRGAGARAVASPVAHPRVRGGDEPLISVVRTVMGSPPRARGRRGRGHG